jgi:hypothetical protein
MRLSKLRKLKYLIEEYEDLDDEMYHMIEDWEHGSPEAAAMSDPSDQFIKSEQLSGKQKQIINHMIEYIKDAKP